MKVVGFDILIEENKSINEFISGGLVLPQIGTLPMAYGRVVQVGDGRLNKKFNEHIPVKVKVGELVIYNPGVAKPITLKNSGKTYLKMKQNEAILVLKEENGEVVGVDRMLQNYVLVKHDEKDTVSLGGIVLPQLKRTVDNISGTVVMTGPGTYNAEDNTFVSGDFKAGDKVSFTEMSAIQLTLPVKQEDGTLAKEKFLEVPATMIDFTFEHEENNMKITRIKDKHVLVTKTSTDKVTSAGIYIPELDTTGHMVEAEIIMVGDKVERAKVGDRIVYVDAKENNREFKYPVKSDNGLTVTKKCYMIPETDIDAYLESDETI